MRPHSLLLVILAAIALAACGSPTPAPPATPDAIALARTAAEQIRAADTFRLTLTQSGPDYRFVTIQGGVTFRRADGLYVEPNIIQAQARVLAIGIPIDIDMFARGTTQWYRAIFTGNNWVRADFAPGFDARALIAEESGFNQALNALQDLDYLGIETLENGQSVHHLRGEAEGEGMNALLVGLMETLGTVGVDVYVDTATGYPARFIITAFEAPYSVDGRFGVDPTVATPTPPPAPVDPYIWTLDLYDINAPAQLDSPPNFEEATAEATAEAATIEPTLDRVTAEATEAGG